MPGIYRPRHPERTVLYRVMFHHFERFVAEDESWFDGIVALCISGLPELEDARKRLAGVRGK